MIRLWRYWCKAMGSSAYNDDRKDDHIHLTIRTFWFILHIVTCLMIITGNGAADKDELQKFVKRKLRIRRKLEIDASDALGVALCHGITSIDSPEEIKAI